MFRIYRGGGGGDQEKGRGDIISSFTLCKLSSNEASGVLGPTWFLGESMSHLSVARQIILYRTLFTISDDSIRLTLKCSLEII